MSRRRHLIASFMLLLLALLPCFACSKAGLTREHAVSVLRKGLNLPETRTGEILVGSILANPHVTNADQFLQNPQGRLFKALSDAGVLSFSFAGTRIARVGDSQYASETMVIQADITEKGRPFLLGTKQVRAGTEATVRLCEMDISEVTGIALDTDAKSARVEYTLRYINITPFGANLGATPEARFPLAASLRLYDDGWRIEQKP